MTYVELLEKRVRGGLRRAYLCDSGGFLRTVVEVREEVVDAFIQYSLWELADLQSDDWYQLALLIACTDGDEVEECSLPEGTRLFYEKRRV